MKIDIIRGITKSVARFTDHFRNFEKVKAVKRIFGSHTQELLANIIIEFTFDTRYMQVTHDGRLLINPDYFSSGNHTDIYLDIIHELVHVHQVLNGKNCNHKLEYVQRPLEIQAYRMAVEEARALGLDDERIMDYLDSDLVNEAELMQLASALEVQAQNGLNTPSFDSESLLP